MVHFIGYVWKSPRLCAREGNLKEPKTLDLLPAAVCKTHCTFWHVDSFFQLTDSRRHNPPVRQRNNLSFPSSQCITNSTHLSKPSQTPQGPDNEKMEQMKQISAAQNELYDRILTQYYMPLQLYVKAKDPKTVTLAEHTRLYKLGKLMETLSMSCQVCSTVTLFWRTLYCAGTPFGGHPIGRPFYYFSTLMGGQFHWVVAPFFGHSIGPLIFYR